MKKVLFIFLLLFYFSFDVFASEEEIKIISRSEWGANESYRYVNNPEWKEILKNRAFETSKEVTEEQAEKWKKRAEKEKEMNAILVNDFYDDVKVKETISYDGLNELAWPIQKTEKINAIVIHHTLSEYEDSYEGVRSIYKFHALTREWGDI